MPSETELARKHGLTEHTATFDEFVGHVETTTSFEEAEVCHMTTIGGDWFIYQATGYRGYVVANQGHAGGDALIPGRTRPVRFWTTGLGEPDGMGASDVPTSNLMAWDVAVAFVTEAVHNDLANEWGE